MKQEKTRMSAGRIKRLMDAALGKEPADLAVVNAKVLNVFTGEILSEHGICVKDGKTVFVGRQARDLADESTHIIDADGMTAIPGFIDGHTHIAGEHLPEEFLKYAMTGGTTTIVTEIFEIYFAAGLSGVLEYMEAVRSQPIKIYAAAPAMVSISDLAAGIDLKDLETILAQPEIICMGESYWQGVLQQPERYLPAFETIRNSGLPLEGHSAGAGEQKLAAYLNAGISSCHEPITAEETLSRLRQGLCVMIREGSVRKDLEAVAGIRREGVDLRRLAVASDGITPEALMEKGYMEALVQKAIALGFAPVDAIRMASLNVAEHFGMDGNIGSIAPGRDADFILIPDLNHIRAKCVISGGEIIAQNGKLMVDPRPHTFSKSSKNTILLPRPMHPADFEIHARNNRSKEKIRVMEMVTNLVTREKIIEAPVHKGLIPADPENDLAKVAAVNRRQAPGKCFTGLIKGFGIKCGALASSGAWDVSDIIVVGADESDMAVAINAIYETGGGIVAVNNGRVTAQMPQPVFGTISELPMERIIECGSEIKSAAESFGINFPDPVLSLNTLTTAAIPFLRICEQGLVDLKTGATLDLFA
ncbi:MAG: amidohydrolase family protein [Desulfobacteraceae bacterium]|nr:amidohydrolase family protein [Desulfobacteraceae bacterium]